MHRVNQMAQRLSVRGFDRQVAGLEIRIAVLHASTAPGIPVSEAVG